MKCIDNVTPRRLLEIIPESIRNRSYIKMELGSKHNIDYVCYSVYPAKQKETGALVTRKDGSQVFQCTAYIGLDGNRYTTAKSETVISQLISETGNYPDEVGQWEFRNLNVDVKIIQVKVKFGDKEYPVFAFEPVNPEF